MSHDLTRRLFLGSLGATVALPAARLSAQAQGAAAAPPAANVEKDVVYGKGGDTDLHLDIYKPTGAANKRMAIVHFHGGGFTGGNKDGLAARLQTMSGRGYVNIAAQYRLSANGAARWPSQIEDVKASIRWTRANASRLGIEPNRIAVAGYSAGGHLALFAAGTANKPEFEGKGGQARGAAQWGGLSPVYARPGG